jgi:lysophospholipase
MEMVLRFRPLTAIICLISLVSFVSAQSYAPINVTCPSDLIRNGSNGLSPQESSYISQRHQKATASLQSWLEGLNFTDFNVSTFLQNASNAPTTGIAFSGGGYRAMLNGAGVFQGARSRKQANIGLDSRVPGNGLMSGFLQSNTYIAGLSGGSWLIGAIAVHDFATIDTMRNDYWHLEDNLVAPAGLVAKVEFYTQIFDQVAQKADAGFET